MTDRHLWAGRTLLARPLPYQGGTLEVSFVTPDTPDGVERATELALFDLHGRRVCTVSRGVFAPGKQEASWNGTDDHGRQVPCGVYFLRLAHHGHTAGSLRVVVARPSE